ncbi:hypothetical protein niasHT_002712 [Heterodera trifolii]|uniref:Eukaryotic translation initiation factor 2 subunit 2 n=1 Tax=Heterodera trifolii TaxID=157864 RepID=A0ABD2I473_9BILA
MLIKTEQTSEAAPEFGSNRLQGTHPFLCVCLYDEYVRCHTCRSSDTELTKDVSRLFFIQCKRCVSRFAVSSIKSGYTAMVGKRAALRRAAEATAGGGTQEFYYPF